MTEEISAAPVGAEPTTATPAAVIETPEGDEPKTLAEPNEVAESEEGEAEDVVEEIEFDFGGNKKKWPKGTPIDQIAEELDKFTKGTWSDYTRKSQEIAEARKALEADQSAVQKIKTLEGEALNSYSRGLSVKAELAQLDAVDLNAMWQSDPDRARRVSDLKAQKQAEFNGLVQRVSQIEQLATQAQQADLARREQEGRSIIEKRIKGFSEKDLVEYAISTGIPKEEAGKWTLSPTVTEYAYKAMLWDRMQATAQKTTKPAPTPATPVVPQKGKGAPAAKSVKDMTVGEMARHLGLS